MSISSWAPASSCSRSAALSFSKAMRRERRNVAIGDTTMNKLITAADLVTPKVTTGSLPASRKVYVRPDAAPELRVPVREITLDASSGEPPLPVYDTTGVYSDPDVAIDVEKGLARTRIEWVKARGGVEEYQGRPIQPVDNGNVSGKHLARNFPNTPKPWRAIASYPSPLRGEGGDPRLDRGE